MPPKKKLSKKEKARLEAEQAELLRIEMEKERQKKLEEERRRKEIEMEQGRQRQKQEVEENRERRRQLKASMMFFDTVHQTINDIKGKEKEQRDWEKYMRCNGLPNANNPSDLRQFMHQWRIEIGARQKAARNWLLRTDERTVLTQDTNKPDLSRVALRQQQDNLGDVFSRRVQEVLGILNELGEVIEEAQKPAHVLDDLVRLKAEMRVFLNDFLNDFTYKIMSQVDRDMEVDRPGVSKNIYSSPVFKSHIWTFKKDAQLSPNSKVRGNEPNQHHEIEFPIMEMTILLPPAVELMTAGLRGLWLYYDHFSDNCDSFFISKTPKKKQTILKQTKKEWRKRKEILQGMLEDCLKERPVIVQPDDSSSTPRIPERTFDVDKVYAEYEDRFNKARQRAIGPDVYRLLETDVNLRKYRIMSGVYCIDYLETPQQDKKLNSRSYIRTIMSADKLTYRHFYQTYKPPPPVLPGVRRLPEEIEAEMRMVEAALDKLALVSLQLPDSVIWFEPPVVCRWETPEDTLECELAENTKPAAVIGTPTEATPLSLTTNPTPVKLSPRLPPKSFKFVASRKSYATLPICEVTDFDLLTIPPGIDIYGLLKSFVVPRLPNGFSVSLDEQSKDEKLVSPTGKRQQRFLTLAKPATAQPRYWGGELIEEPEEEPIIQEPLPDIRIDESFLDYTEPCECFPHVELEKELRFKNLTDESSTRKEHLTGRKRRSGRKGLKKGKVGSAASSKVSFGETKIVGESSEGKHRGQRTYMFSTFLKDLDNLNQLQMSHLDEAVAQIQVNLNGGEDSMANSCEDLQNGEGFDEMDNMESMDSQQPPPGFDYYSSISFEQELNGRIGHPVEEATTTAPNEFGIGLENEEESSSSSDSDDTDSDDVAGHVTMAGRLNGSIIVEDVGEEEDNTLLGNLNSLNCGDAMLGIPSSALHDTLGKHGQEQFDNIPGSNGKFPDELALTQGKWSSRDVHDTKFNEDKLTIQFRTGRFGIFGFALNRYSNMPYQTWEIKPDFRSPATVSFSFTASIISMEVTVTAEGYALTNFQGGTTEAINGLIGRTVSMTELKTILVDAAVDVFPEEDTFCYTEGTCEKNYVMEMHLYECIAALAQSHNFGWSRWNLLAGSRTVVLLMREMQEGKKVPNHSTLLVTPLKTSIIECTEVSASFNSTGIPGMEYYPDLYQLAQVHALPSSLEKQRTMDPVLRDNVAGILMAIRPVSFC